MHILHQFLKLFFENLYHNFAWSYDAIAWLVSLGQWRLWTEQGIPFLIGPRVLELGHGPGHLQVELLHEGMVVYGLDESRQMSQIASENIQRFLNQINPSIAYDYAHFLGLLRGVGQALPFSSHSINSILATFPTEYITYPITLQEIKRVLQPGGRFVIVLGAWITGNSVPHRLAAQLFKITGQAPEWRPEYAQPLNQAGFSVEQHLIELPSSKVLVLVAY